MTAEKSLRFALTGSGPEGGNRTIVLWQKADLVNGKVERRLLLAPPDAIEVAQVLLAVAR